MWNHWINTVDDNGEVTVPIPGAPQPGEILDGVVRFVIDHPLPVAAAFLSILAVRAWQRKGVSKGILIGVVLAVGYFFIAGSL